MKKLIIITLLALFVFANQLYSQGTDYFEGKTSVCYGGECYAIKDRSFNYGICNAKNVMNTGILPWRVDGKPRESEEFSPDIPMISENQLLRAFIETFTVGEIEALKDENKSMLIGFYVNPVNGTVSEVSFSVRKERYAPIVTPDKIYMLEKLLKSYVTFDTSDPRHRKYNYIAMTTFYKFKFAWDLLKNPASSSSEVGAIQKSASWLSVNGMYVGDKYTYNQMVAKLGNPTGSRTYSVANTNFTEYQYGGNLFIFENGAYGNKFAGFTVNNSNFIVKIRDSALSVGEYFQYSQEYEGYPIEGLSGSTIQRIMLNSCGGYLEILKSTTNPRRPISSLGFVSTK